MPAHTHYLWFKARKREEIIDITDEVTEQLRQSGIREGFALVTAMHISTSGLGSACSTASGVASVASA